MELDHESYTLGRAELSSDYSSLDLHPSRAQAIVRSSKIEAPRKAVKEFLGRRAAAYFDESVPAILLVTIFA